MSWKHYHLKRYHTAPADYRNRLSLSIKDFNYVEIQRPLKAFLDLLIEFITKVQKEMSEHRVTPKNCYLRQK